MLERFKVPLADQVRVSHESLGESVAAIFEKMDTSAEDAAVGADVLVTTDLPVVENHGVSKMLTYHVDSYQTGLYIFLLLLIIPFEIRDLVGVVKIVQVVF